MTKSLAGIKDVLSGYVTVQPQTPREVSPSESKKPQPKQTAALRTRLGRPPGKQPINRRPKEKATLRIDTELMADYRDWSWDERCQLGELVERALADYRRRRR